MNHTGDVLAGIARVVSRRIGQKGRRERFLYSGLVVVYPDHHNQEKGRMRGRFAGGLRHRIAKCSKIGLECRGATRVRPALDQFGEAAGSKRRFDRRHGAGLHVEELAIVLRSREIQARKAVVELAMDVVRRSLESEASLHWRTTIMSRPIRSSKPGSKCFATT